MKHSKTIYPKCCPLIRISLHLLKDAGFEETINVCIQLNVSLYRKTVIPIFIIIRLHLAQAVHTQ